VEAPTPSQYSRKNILHTSASYVCVIAAPVNKLVRTCGLFGPNMQGLASELTDLVALEATQGSPVIVGNDAKKPEPQITFHTTMFDFSRRVTSRQ